MKKKKFVLSPGEGYKGTDLKQSLHLHTGHGFWNLKIPGCDEKYPYKMAQQLDHLAMKLIQVLAEHAFNLTLPTLTHRADLPVAMGDQCGMLDVVYYYNQKSVSVSPPVGHSTAEVNVVPHYDPGLFSISFYSSHAGLQLYDPTVKKWFAGPVNTVPGQENFGVIWLGEIAAHVSKGALKAGVHRVVYPSEPNTQRFTAWYEVCTVDQINRDKKPPKITGDNITLPNLPGSQPIDIKEGEDGMEMITRHYGIPMSKSVRLQDGFAGIYSDDLKDALGKNMWQVELYKDPNSNSPPKPKPQTEKPTKK